MTNLPKRLIEVDLPIRRISEHARREKSIRHGHISTLHIWWARRPLAACRAVLCASLWPDPADPNCPEAFVAEAKGEMLTWTSHERQQKLSVESRVRFNAARKDANHFDDLEVLRMALLDYIADFANWDNSTDNDFLTTTRTLTQCAHEAMGGVPGARPLVVDPFAGGGSIPLEALRVGADAFASDINPIPVLLNKVILEYIPKYGQLLADEVRKWGQWIRQEAEKELSDFYPIDPDGSTPIAYLWARTICCEGPSCGKRIPMLSSGYLKKKKDNNIGISISPKNSPNIRLTTDESEIKSTTKGFAVTCPFCGFTTGKKQVQKQIKKVFGGANDSVLLAVLKDKNGKREYRLAEDQDLKPVRKCEIIVSNLIETNSKTFPSEEIPQKGAHRAVGSQWPLYGFRNWSDLFMNRQKLTIHILQNLTRKAHQEILKQKGKEFAEAIFLLLAYAVDKQADYSSSLCRWVAGGEFIAGTLAGEKKFPMIADFAESNPIGCGSGSWDKHLDWILRFLERESLALSESGTVVTGSAITSLLPEGSAAAIITDPPYYDSVPYADLSDFYYVWLKRTLLDIIKIDSIGNGELTPKDEEMTVNQPLKADQKKRYEDLLTGAFSTAKNTVSNSGIAVIVFAHKSTAGWETLLEAICRSGWKVTASWPVDTERSSRLNANETASLASSVHIVCRPRRVSASQAIGDWRDVLSELPKRIHAWLPRLAEEGVVGADAIFACLGPALEIFSRYDLVEKASGEVVSLREYLEQVWAAVSREALSSIVADSDLSGFEADARLTAMWLWTVAGRAGEKKITKGEQDDFDDEENTPKKSKVTGFTLEYDAARKIAQGLGASLEAMKNLVAVKGDKATLLSVGARTEYLFGKGETEPATAKGRKKKSDQMDLFAELVDDSVTEAVWQEKTVSKPGETVLDRVHQAMILFAAGRSEALKRFLVEDGAGNDPGLWKLAQALSALYPIGTQEKRWVDGVLARKKGLGF